MTNNLHIPVILIGLGLFLILSIMHNTKISVILYDIPHKSTTLLNHIVTKLKLFTTINIFAFIVMFLVYDLNINIGYAGDKNTYYLPYILIPIGNTIMIISMIFLWDTVGLICKAITNKRNIESFKKKEKQNDK